MPTKTVPSSSRSSLRILFAASLALGACGGSVDPAGPAAADGGVDAPLGSGFARGDTGADTRPEAETSAEAATDAGGITVQQAYVKASNAAQGAFFGTALALSADGNTLAVGAEGDESDATGIDGDQTDTSARNAGAVYVFVRTGSTWTQQAYVKPSNTRVGLFFGGSVALSADGDTLAVGADGDSSDATGVNGDADDTSAVGAGAAYVFKRTGTAWAQEAYLKASNTGAGDAFGGALTLSADGNTLAISAVAEGSDATGIDGDQSDDSLTQAGAVYVFTRSSGTATWVQQAYVKASNTGTGAAFGDSLVLSGDGDTLAVGADGESSGATGIDGNESDTSDTGAGAVYVFSRSGATWAQVAYVKPSNTGVNDMFGCALAISSDGSELAVGALGESSDASGVNGDQSDTSDPGAGAVYLFTRTGTTWSQQAYVKASNPWVGANFGDALAMSSDGVTLAVGANGEPSDATGIGGDQSNTSDPVAGAVYLFTHTSAAWTQAEYVKASNTSAGANFGSALAISSDATTLAVGAASESGGSDGVNGNESSQSTTQAGAVYVFR